MGKESRGSQQSRPSSPDEVVQSEVREVKQPQKNKGFWGLLIVTLLYVISPIDIVPEAILGPLGYLDDAALLAYLLKRIFNRFK